MLQAEDQRIAVMARAKDAVVAIFAARGQGGGSGVLVSADGYVLSNFHVARPCGNAMQCGLPDGRVYDAVVVGLDPTGDVALIKLLGRDDFPHAELGDSDQLRPGDWVFAMGNPFLLAADFQPTVTYGIVSGLHRYQYPDGTLLEYTDCIQTDASINPGNSGGPLFDVQGRLIGINGRCSFEKRGRVNVGVGYAVSINQIKNFLGVLRSGRIVDHATMGTRVSSDDSGRVVVSEILETSDAYRRGLRYDDEIVSFGGRTISTANGFKNILGIFPKGWRVPLSYRREGKRYDVLVRLSGVHSQQDLLEKTLGRPPELMPLPKPGERPEPKDRGKGPPKPPQTPPDDLPRLVPGPAAPMPESVKKCFREKSGFANYYFNELEQQRVWKAWTARAKFAGLGGTWTISGPLESGGTFRCELGDDGGRFKRSPVNGAAADDVKWTAGTDFSTSLLPAHSGGLLPALYLWRRLALEGLAHFGELYYYGTAPVPGGEGQADVLVGQYKHVECRFYFDRAQGQLVAVEMYPDAEADPCEIRFSEFRDVQGRSLPARMEVRTGDDLYGVFSLAQCTVGTGEQKSRGTGEPAGTSGGK
ncbi:MAG: trypsin-like peptidase domain-containing protein [Thermoguttaceae bacterium]